MNRILFIGYNFAPEPTGIGKYSGEMITWLAQRGYHCTVLTGYPYYPFWKVQPPFNKKYFWYSNETRTFPGGGKIEIRRCPMYVPQKPSGLKRILLDMSFTCSAGVALLRQLFQKKYDFVISVAPSFQLGLLGVIYKMFHKSRLIYHVQDMQIEAARDLQMIRSKRILNILFKFEKYILRHSDMVSTISEQMVHKMEQKTEQPVALFPNWADAGMFFPMENRHQLKTQFGFKSSDYVILYSGGIGEKQGIEAILHAADHFRAQKHIRFAICGSGPYKDKLKALAQELELDNVLFFSLQPRDTFNAFLNAADLHLVVQKSDASDLMMPSKLTTILSVGGLVLVTANKGSGLEKVINKYKMGIVVDAEDQDALNSGIAQALAEDHEQKRHRAREYAEKYLSKENVLQSFESEVMKSSLPCNEVNFSLAVE